MNWLFMVTGEIMGIPAPPKTVVIDTIRTENSKRAEHRDQLAFRKSCTVLQ